jgi:hypothetical protein
VSPRNTEASQEDLEREVAALMAQRKRLESEEFFRADAVENLTAMVDRARRWLASQFPPRMWLEPQAPERLVNGPLPALAILASEWFFQAELERIAGSVPQPSVPSLQWSDLTKAETVRKIVEVDARLAELDVELRKVDAAARVAAAQAELRALESGVDVTPEPSKTAVGDQDDAEAQVSA